MVNPELGFELRRVARKASILNPIQGTLPLAYIEIGVKLPLKRQRQRKRETKRGRWKVLEKVGTQRYSAGE